MQSFGIPYEELTVSHPRLGHKITLKVPTKAKHRPALISAYKGRYHEPFSHVNFTKILAYTDRKSVVHAGTFYGDMLHTYAQCARRVYAFEPVLENYVLAKLNAQSLGLDNVYLSNCALSDADGLVRLKTHMPDGTFIGGGSYVAEPSEQPDETATCYRMDSLPLEDIGLIQLDVEDHELSALRGGETLIRQFQPIILIEDNQRNCADYLGALGYQLSFSRGGLSYWGMAKDIDFLDSLNT